MSNLDQEFANELLGDTEKTAQAPPQQPQPAAPGNYGESELEQLIAMMMDEAEASGMQAHTNNPQQPAQQPAEQPAQEPAQEGTSDKGNAPQENNEDNSGNNNSDDNAESDSKDSEKSDSKESKNSDSKEEDEEKEAAASFADMLGLEKSAEESSNGKNEMPEQLKGSQNKKSESSDKEEKEEGKDSKDKNSDKNEKSKSDKEAKAEAAAIVMNRAQQII